MRVLEIHDEVDDELLHVCVLDDELLNVCVLDDELLNVCVG